MLYIVFGHCGAGKTYISKILSKELKCLHLECDDWLTEEMKYLIKFKLPFPKKVIDKYIDIIISKLKKIITGKKNVLISQAFFLIEHRKKLNEISPYGCQFIQIVAKEEVISKRVMNSRRLINDPVYIKEINKHFQYPSANENVMVIDNNKDGKANILLYVDTLKKVDNL